jgi:hypothetical protein
VVLVLVLCLGGCWYEVGVVLVLELLLGGCGVLVVVGLLILLVLGVGGVWWVVLSLRCFYIGGCEVVELLWVLLLGWVLCELLGVQGCLGFRGDGGDVVVVLLGMLWLFGVMLGVLLLM